MAPEQIAGGRTDARTDQFSFCVALYQALHGAHPFGGENLYELAAAVVEGRLQPPPAEERGPTLAAPDPAARAVRATGRSLPVDGGAAAGARPRSGAGGAGDSSRSPPAWRRSPASRSGHRGWPPERPSCDGGASRMATAWAPARRDALEKAFVATGNKGAAQALAGTAALLDGYAARWSGLFKETCEATHVRGEQSAEVLDLRMSCLDEQLASVRALVDTLASADAAVVDKAVGAAAALPSLDRCNDTVALRAMVKPPEDQTTRRKVAELRERVATVAALTSAGRCEQATRIGRPIKEAAAQIGYLPLHAEASFALGRRFDDCVDTKEALADLEDAVMSAEASRYDEIAVEAAGWLASTHANRMHDLRTARLWLRLAEAILARFRGILARKRAWPRAGRWSCSAKAAWRRRSTRRGAGSRYRRC